MSYGTFETLALLNEYESILYLDFDILLLESVDELLKVKSSQIMEKRSLASF